MSDGTICKGFDGAPTSASLMVHNFDDVSAVANRAVPGGLHLRTFNDGYEVFDVVLFTGNAALAGDLAAAISEVVAKHKAIAEAPARVAEAA